MTTHARRRRRTIRLVRGGGVSCGGSVVTRLASGAAGLALRRVTGNELSAGELSHGRRLYPPPPPPAPDPHRARKVVLRLLRNHRIGSQRSS